MHVSMPAIGRLQPAVLPAAFRKGGDAGDELFWVEGRPAKAQSRPMRLADKR
jgi:hypothetical protein